MSDTRTLYVVDAFTDKPFHGNPAAVCVLDNPADEGWMKLVAREMNLAETAFLYPFDGGWNLRWFTPTVEVKLCGHATLAGAFVLWHTGKLAAGEPAKFHTLSGGLTCTRRDGLIAMDFPAKIAEACDPPVGLEQALGIPGAPRWVGRNNMDYLVEVADESTLRSLKPDHSRRQGRLARRDCDGEVRRQGGRCPAYERISQLRLRLALLRPRQRHS